MWYKQFIFKNFSQTPTWVQEAVLICGGEARGQDPDL